MCKSEVVSEQLLNMKLLCLQNCKTSCFSIKDFYTTSNFVQCSYNFNNSLTLIRFTNDDIVKPKKPKNLKTHGHDMISIQVVKLSDASLCKPLELIFKSCLESGKFPLEWKKASSCK